MENLVTANNAVGAIDGGLTPTATTLTLKDISNFPVLTDVKDYCILTLIHKSDGSLEYVKCTAQDIGLKQYTIERAQEDTIGLLFEDDDEVRNLLTEGQIEYLKDSGGGTGAYVKVSTGQLLEAQTAYMYDASTEETYQLPPSPAEGDIVVLAHTEVGTSTITVDGNGNDILQYPNTTDTSISLDIVGAYIELTYNGTDWFVSDFSGTIGENSDLVPRNSIAIIEDQKPAGTDGGTFTSGAWRTRDLNTITSDPDSIVTLNANQFTLEAGDYLIEGYVSAYTVNVHQAGIYNITDSQFNFYGSSQSASSGNAGSNRSIFSGRITISIPKVFEVRHECGTTKTSDGLGRSTSLGAYELYTQVKITKLG